MAHENFTRVEGELRRTVMLLEGSTDIEVRKTLLRRMKTLLDEADQILSQHEAEQTDANITPPKSRQPSRTDFK